MCWSGYLPEGFAVVVFELDGAAVTDPESNKTLDLCLFRNGVPVATAELKNHLTGQNIEQAIGHTVPTAIPGTLLSADGRLSTSRLTPMLPR